MTASSYFGTNKNVSAGIGGPPYNISVSKTLLPGNYYLNNLNANLTIDGSGPVNIYVKDTLSFASKNVTINADSGPLNIYFHGSGTVDLGGASLNSGGDAGNLRIICDTGLTAPFPTPATTFDFESGSGGTYSGLFYAPYADLTFKNNDNVRGLLWGKTLTVKNNMNFQYDAAAASFFGSALTPLLGPWKQL